MVACFKVAQNRAEEKSEIKELGERVERRVSSSSLPAPNSFFLLVFFAPSPLSLAPGIGFSGASRLSYGSKKERHQNYECT